MDPFGEHLDAEGDDERATERDGVPQPVVGGTPRVQADDEAGPRRAYAGLDIFEVWAEMRAAALLARLDEDDTPAVRGIGRGESRECADRGEDRVPVVSGSPSVQALALAHRDERVEPLPPAAEGRLFVEVAVEQGDEPSRGTGRGRHVRDDGGSQALVFDDLDGAARERPRRSPLGEQPGSATNLTVVSPAGVEVRRKTGDGNVGR